MKDQELVTIKITRCNETIAAWLSLPDVENGKLTCVLSGPASVDRSTPEMQREAQINRGAWWEAYKPAIYAAIAAHQKAE